MSVESFEDLKKGLCNLLGQPSEALNDESQDGDLSGTGVDGFALMTDDAAVTLCQFPDVRTDRAFLICDYGDVPEDLELLVLRRVLETNFLMYRGNSTTFAREPVTGHLLLLGEVLFATATADSVLEAMQRFADGVKEFRKGHFVEDLTQRSQGQRNHDPDVKAMKV
jgi:hypothetical protein